MTIQDIILSRLVNDQTTIRISQPYTMDGKLFKSRKSAGNWYQDHILDLESLPIKLMEWNAETNELSIVLFEREVNNENH